VREDESGDSLGLVKTTMMNSWAEFIRDYEPKWQ